LNLNNLIYLFYYQMLRSESEEFTFDHQFEDCIEHDYGFVLWSYW
jgi:hypothetical protein